MALDALHQRGLEEVEVFHGQAGAKSHAVESVLGYVTRDAGNLGEQTVHVAQQGTASGHDHALVDDVARELRWRFLEYGAHRRDDLLQRLLTCTIPAQKEDRHEAFRSSPCVAQRR